MTDISAVTAAADRLWEAQSTGIPCRPVRDLVADVEAAYAVQRHNLDRLIEGGWRRIGGKIGLTSDAVQRQLGVDQPDYGTLFAELTTTSGEPVPVEGLLQPKVEAEVALVLAEDLTGLDTTPDDVIAAVGQIAPALEIVDSRIADWDITLVDTVADNASCGRLVLGPAATDPAGLDLVALEMSMAVNGETRSVGTGADCLGSPLVAAAWLARTMAQLGTPLRAGDVVLTGALGPMYPVAAGDHVTADLGALGTVEATFTTAGES